jgi:DNA helicase-2/ATP-dependent DNA helicase PcrA
MDLLGSLNPQQRIAVEHGIGPALVLAGAGSGKTRVIAFRIAHLVRNGASRPENILAVTFTNKAAKEMRERVHALLGPSRTAEPLISTFHSFCVRLLRREIHRIGFRRDFSIYDTDDQRRLMKQIFKDTGRIEKELAPREVLSRISYAKNHSVSPEQYTSAYKAEDAGEIAGIYELYDSRLLKSNALDFDDILLRTVELLTKFPEQRDYYSNWYRFILVDEYQDTNRPQYDLLRLMTARHTNLFVVGDEDQSIYKFRGADIQNILRFEKDFPGARVVKLEQNYRSTQNILKVADAVVKNNTERKGKTLWTENVAGDIITCHCSSSAREEGEWVCGLIREILDDNPDYHAAVLYRANFISRSFEEVLLEYGMPYTVVGGIAFFARMEIKDLLAYLRVIYNPEDDVAFLRIVNTPSRGIGGATIELLTRTALEKGIPLEQALQLLSADPQLPVRAAKALQAFQRKLESWRALRDETPAGDLLEKIVSDVEYRQMLMREDTAEEAQERMGNIEELIRAASDSEDRGETIFEFLDRASLSSELDALDERARITLMTLHSAKGLEFDVVFLAGLEEGLFPHAQSMNSAADLEEERRLCYVGITRARRKLYLAWTPFRRNYGPTAGQQSLPSRFLNEMPPNLLEGYEPHTSIWFDEEKDEDEGGFAIEEEEGDAGEFRPSIGKSVPKSALAQPKSLAELRAYVDRQNRERNPGAASLTQAPVLKTGMRVRHAQFGDGIILNREKHGNDIKLTITFSRVGRKTLIERFAKLKAL